MEKRTFVKIVARRNRMKVKDAKVLVDSVFEVIGDALAAHEPVMITGFGVFEVRYHTGRNIRNIRTGEVFTNAAFYRPWFRAFPKMKARVNKQ